MKLKGQYIFIVGMCITAMLTACTTSPKSKTLSLAEKGLSLIEEVDTLAECEDYIAIYTAGDEISDVIKGIAEHDYKEPKAIFVMEDFDRQVYDNMISEKKLPEEIEHLVKGKFAGSLPSQINAMNGAMTLGATSILRHNDSFIYAGLKAPAAYLYTFGNDYSFMVTFVPNDENIVNAAVDVIINRELGALTTNGEVEGFFKDSLGFKDISVSMAEGK